MKVDRATEDDGFIDFVPGRAPCCRESLSLDLCDKRDGEFDEAGLTVARLMVRDTDGRGPPLMRLTTNRAAPTFLLSPFCET